MGKKDGVNPVVLQFPATSAHTDCPLKETRAANPSDVAADAGDLLRRYELLARHSRDIVLFIRCGDGKILEANTAAEKAYGYSHEELLSLTVLDIRAVETLDDFPAQLAEAEEKGLLFETYHRRRDGSTFPVEVSAQGARSGGSRTLISIVRDITERKAVDETLRRNESTLRGILEAAKESIWLFSPDGTVLLGNHTAFARFGKSATEIIGKKITEFVPKELACNRLARLNEVVASNCPAEFEDERDGILFHHTFYPVSEADGTVSCIAAFSRDITGRRRAEEELRRSRERLTWVLDRTGVGLWLNELPLGALNWDKRTRDLFYVRHDQEPTIDLFWSRLHPDDREPTRLAVEKSLRDGGLYEIDHRVVDPDTGAIRWIRSTGQALTGHDGSPVQFDGINYDITDRKLVEEAQRQMNDQLHLLADTARQLLETDSPQEVVETLCRNVMEFLHCDVFFNFLVDEDACRLRLNACSGIPADNLEALRWLDFGVAVCGCVARDAMPIVAESIAESDDPRTALVKSFGIRAYACNPLMGRQKKVIGTLSFGSRSRDRFGDDELGLMKTIADQVAIAVDRMKYQEELKKAHDRLEISVRQRTEELSATVDALKGEVADRLRTEEHLQRLNRLYTVLSEINQAIVRATGRASLFDDFCRIAVEDGGFLLCWVGMLDEPTGDIRLVAQRGAIGYLDGIRITTNKDPSGLGPTGIVVREGSHYICNDFLNAPCTRPWQERAGQYGIRASASIALKLEGRVVGALTLYSGEKNFFDRQQVDLLRQMSADISFALDTLETGARRRQAESALQAETEERLRAMNALREKEQIMMQQGRHAAMGEMIGNIAHQWRQPLNTLGLIVQDLPLRSKRGKLTHEYVSESVNRAKEIIFHMSQTIDDFRNFFRADKEKVRFRVGAVINKTLELISASFKALSIRIDFHISGDPEIFGYPNELSQVIFNILGNARDVFLERKIARPEITISVAADEAGNTVIVIADNGGGIPEENMVKIFDPYFTTKGPDKGTGIGLHMSKTIIEKNMGGTLTARNNGAGAEFRLEV